MDLRFTTEEQAFRAELRQFFREAIAEEIRHRIIAGRRITRAEATTCQRILHARGLAVPHWPIEWGGAGWTAVQYHIYREEMNAAGVPEPVIHNVTYLGPVIVAFGDQRQKEFFLPKLANLDLWFCQGFSEPGAGSDLASLKTAAQRQGDHYIVNGQKMWTTNAHRADWVFALVRTDPNARKKQEGISMLLIDLKTPGVTVRPIVTIDRRHETNEVFFDNVKVPVENRIGEENRGWDFGKVLLSHERMTAGARAVGHVKARVSRARKLAATVPVGDGSLLDDPLFRYQLAGMEVDVKALEITQMRAIAAEAKLHGTQPNQASSVCKIRGTELQQESTEFLLKMAGPYALPYRPDEPHAESAPAAIGPEWSAPLAPD